MFLPRWPALVLEATAMCLCAATGTAHAADLQPRTVAAFDRYVAATEARTTSAAPVLWIDDLPEEQKQQWMTAVRRDGIFIQPIVTRSGGRDIEVPDGLIHHWLGVTFIPGRAAGDAVRLLQAYDRHSEIFAPVVQGSRIISREGDHFSVFLRFRQQKVITVVVNTEHDARFVHWAAGHVSSRITSTRIAEVENAGAANEREKPVGRDGGYLWRLNSYWRFLERDNGVYVQCESITLTRGIPIGFGWLVRPFVTSIPRETLTFTLETVRKQLMAR